LRKTQTLPTDDTLILRLTLTLAEISEQPIPLDLFESIRAE